MYITILLITCEVFWVAVGSIGTIFVLCHAVSSYNKDSKIQQQQRTVEAYLPIREEYYELTERLQELNEAEKDSLKKEYLGKMEILSAGINSKAYSLEYINRVSGGKLVRQFNEIMKPFIIDRRKNKKQHYIEQENLYCEYESMMKSLFKLRKEKWEPLISDEPTGKTEN